MWTPQYWSPWYWTQAFWAWARSGHTVIKLDAGYDVKLFKASVKRFEFPASVNGPIKLKARSMRVRELPISLDY